MTGELFSALGNTLILAAPAAVLGFSLGTIFGMVAAFNYGRWLDKLLSVITILGLSLPDIVAGAVLRRLDSDDRQRVIWSFVDARYNEPVPELALWGTEIGLWDWDVVNDRLTWINDWCEHSQLAAFSGYGHEQLWSSRIHPEDLPAYREALTRHLEGQTPPLVSTPKGLAIAGSP